jgi:type II secretion system protein I
MTRISKAGTSMTNRNSRAFTFIEVLVALAIASIALLGLLRLQVIGLATAQTAAAETDAVFLAQEKIAEVCAVGFPKVGTDAGAVERNGVRFEWTTRVADCRSSATNANRQLIPSGLREVNAEVSWQRGSGHKSIQMATYAAESRFNE